MDLRRLELLLARQHGLVTRRQAEAEGISRSAWYRALDRSVVPVHPGVARALGHPVTTDQRILAAVLACGHGALASHRSAAHLHGFDIAGDDPVEVLTTCRDRRPVLAGVVVHRPTDRHALGSVARSGIPSTGAARTLVDLGAVAPESTAAFLEHLLIGRRLTLAQARRTLERHARPGRSGCGPLRAALDAWSLGLLPPDSALEPAFSRFLHRHGLPPAVFHHRVGRYEPDFAWIEWRVIAEVDGWQKYTDRRAFERQLARDAALQGLGWIVVHITWRQLHEEPAAVAGGLRTVLRARGAAV